MTSIYLLPDFHFCRANFLQKIEGLGALNQKKSAISIFFTMKAAASKITVKRGKIIFSRPDFAFKNSYYSNYNKLTLKATSRFIITKGKNILLSAESW